MGTTLQLGFANLFGALSVLLVALAFSTDHWMEYYVKRDDLKRMAISSPSLNTSLYTDPLFFTRNRGLFRVCYSGDDTVFFDSGPYLEDVIDGSCLPEKGYEIKRDPATLNHGDDYESRIHMMRAHFAFFVLALLFLVIGCIMGAVGCWNVDGRLLRATGLITFVGAFFVATGMALFHGYEYLEGQKIDVPGFVKNWSSNKWLSDEYTRVEYGYSYILGWIGMGIGAIAAILFLCAAYTAQAAREDKEPRYSKRSKASRNRAYDYMDQPQQGPPAIGYGDDMKYGAYPAAGGYPAANTYPGGQSYPMAQPYYTESVPGFDYGGYRY